MTYAEQAGAVGAAADEQIAELVAQLARTSTDLTVAEQQNVRDAAKIAGLLVQVDSLQAKLDALTPKPATIYGSCLAADGQPLSTKVAKMQALFGGVKVLRAFDGGKGPGTWGRDGEQLVPTSVTVISSYKQDPVAIAKGTHDAAWVALWKSTPTDRGGETFWCYAHEGDKKVKDGVYTLPQLMAAWRHLIALWGTTPGVKHTKPMPIWTAWVLMPGESYRNIDGYLLDVPDLGFDVYSDAQITLSQTYAKAKGKRLHVPEFGHPSPTGLSDDAMLAYLTSTDKMWTLHPPATIAYFNANVGGDHPLDSRPKSAARWAEFCDR